MSLIHWWPLNGNTDNYGISNTALTLHGTVNCLNDGKIGKTVKTSSSFYFDSAHQASSELSLAFWVYPDTTTLWLDMFSIGTNLGRIELTDASTFNYNWYQTSNGGTDLCASGASLFKLGNQQWYHIAMTADGANVKFYVNGELKKTLAQTGQVAAAMDDNLITWARRGVSSSAIYTAKYNDIRIYNHALSAKEVKEISKGLILHYNFEDNCQQLVNAYDEPTFNTSAANGGWGHWGSTGHAGSYAQNTDAAYIYPGFSSYSHKVANGSNATNDFLLYQEKLFDGGYRSMQAIIKASDGAAITNYVCYPAWNGRDGGVASGSWTSIESIGNGFYLCKVEGIKQTTSPSSKNAHLVGIYVRAGKTIYVTCCYLENGKQLCSDIFDPNPKCYDCSGYGYNGTVTGNIQLSSDSAAGKHSIYSPAGANYVERQNFPVAGFNVDQQFTINAWIKIVGYVGSDWNTIFRLAATDARDQQLHLCYNSSGNIILSQYSDDPQFTTNVALNTWAMVTWVHYKDGTTAKCKYFVNGQQVGNTQSYSGLLNIQDKAELTLFYDSIRNNYGSNLYIGDFKIYSTALSAEDILTEYNRKAAIDKNGNLFTGEIIETAGSATKIDKNSFIDSNLFATAMTLEDGSVWAPICVHYVPDGLFTGSSNTFYYTGRNVWENFGAINDLERPESNQWEFYVMQQNTVDGAFSKYRFKQNVSPLSATWDQVNPSKVGTNVTRISSSKPNNYAGMYWYNNSNVAMCFANGSNGNWYGCGIRAAFQGGIPGYNGETVKGWQLVYMRISKHNARMFKNGIMIPTDIIEN